MSDEGSFTVVVLSSLSNEVKVMLELLDSKDNMKSKLYLLPRETLHKVDHFG